MTDLPGRPRVVRVAAHQRRHVEGNGQPATAGLEQHLVPRVGLHGVAESGELPDRPGTPAVSGRVEPARERELPRPADPLEVRHYGARGRPVDGIHLDP